MDIQAGDKVTYEVERIKYTEIISNRGLAEKLNSDPRYEILKIERPVYNVIEEKKELLTEEEKKFLKGYIKFANYVPNQISKDNRTHKILFYVDEYLRDNYEFYKAFENLESNKIYTLKELGLE